MEHRERVASPADSSEEFSPRAGLPEGLIPALQELYRALHSTSIYPVGHPAIRVALERAWGLLDQILCLRPSLLIGVARDHLIVDRIALDDGPAVLSSLAQFLHALDIAVLELRSGLTASELERFLLRLRDARQASRSGASLAVALAEDQLEFIRIFPVDYWGLTFSPQVDRQRSGGDSPEVWEGLVVNLTDLAYSRSGVDPEALADEANRQFVSQEGVGGGLLRQQFQNIGRRMPAMDEWQREALRGRLSRFVGALNPSLRQDLLRVDPLDSQGSLDVMAELSDTLPDDTLLEVLRDINRTGQRAHDQFLNFLNKMARVPGDTGAPAGVDLGAVLKRWQVSGTLEEDARSFRSALKQVLVRKREVECNPEPYQELLDDLTHREISPVRQSLAIRYRDPSDAEDVRAQAAELAVHLLTDPGGREHVAGILAHIGAVTDPLLDTGRFQVVREAAVAARLICAHDDGTDEARRAAAGYLRDFTAEERIDRILDRAVRAGQPSSAFEPLLALGGATAVGRMLDRMDSETETAMTTMLLDIAAGMGRGPLSQVVESRWEAGWERLSPLFPVLRRMAPHEAVPLLEELAGHGESKVRREALTLLCDIDPSPRSPECHLKRFLADPDATTVKAVLRMLGELRTDSAVEILGSYLEGSVRGAAPSLRGAQRACSALLRSGEPGQVRLCAALDRLRVSLRSSRIRTGASIRSALADRCGDPLVAAAVGRWRRSPAGVLSLVLRGAPGETREERE